jgi:hypothetical protein
MKRRDSFTVGRLAGYAHGIRCDSDDLGIHVCAMLEHEVKDFRIDAWGDCCGAASASSIWINAGSQQEGTHAHADDVRVSAFVEQHANDFHIVVDQSAKQRRGSGAEKRVAKTTALTTGTTLAELGIRIDAGCQQGIDDLHARCGGTADCRNWCRFTSPTRTARTSASTASAATASSACSRLTCAAASGAASAKSGANATILLIDSGVERRAPIHIPEIRVSAMIQEEFRDAVLVEVESDD